LRALPAAVTSRAKTGFTTPVETWMRSDITASKSELRNVGAATMPWVRDWSRVVGARLH
jgi:hypothetical protein